MKKNIGLTKEVVERGLAYLPVYFAALPENLRKTRSIYGFTCGNPKATYVWPALHMLGVTQQEYDQDNCACWTKATFLVSEITRLTKVPFMFYPEKALEKALEILNAKN